MSERLLVAEAKRRKEVFENLQAYLEIIVRAVRELDPGAKVHLFGSVAENKHLLSSDIDVLVVTRLDAGKVLAHLWRHGIKDPFEIHVIPPELLPLYKRRSKLVEIRG